MDTALLRARLSSQHVLRSAPSRCLSGSRGVRLKQGRHRSRLFSRLAPAPAARRSGSTCFLRVSTQLLTPGRAAPLFSSGHLPLKCSSTLLHLA